MTRQEALAEAQRRWGPKARINHILPERRAGEREMRSVGVKIVRRRVYRVGYSAGEHVNYFEECGRGPTYEAAFRDADARSSR